MGGKQAMSMSKRWLDQINKAKWPDEEFDYYDDRDPESCDHQYAERTTAPLGVTCIKCGHFVGAWE
jgi:hypothetical protein